jgi:translation initiation factor 1
MPQDNRNRRAKPRLAPADAPFNDALRGLAGKFGPQHKSEGAGPAHSPVRPRPPAKAVIRLEKKGRAGKEVTVIDQLDLSQGELSEWLRDLKQRLGCGGAIEERALVLQGNQCQRVRAYLETRAVGQIRGPK